MGLDEFMKKLIEDESVKYELSDSSSENCWNEISRAISKKQKLSCRLKRKLYKVNIIVPLRDIGFAAIVIALCILVPFGINRYKNNMNQYKQSPGTKVDTNKDKNQNKNQDNDKNDNKNSNTVDDSQAELKKKLYSIVDEIAKNKFKKYAIQSWNPYILSKKYDYEFYIHEITEENRVPKEIRCIIDKDNFTVKAETIDYSSKYEHVEDLINLVEGYNDFGTGLAYDIPEENTEKIEYYVHQKSPDDPDKVFYSYNYDEHTLYRKDNNTGKYNAIYKYELNSNGPMVKHVDADLNGDGINEHVSYDFVSGILSVNNMKMEYISYPYYKDYNNVLYTIDIDKSDNTKEIVLREYYPNDVKASQIFYYNNGILDFCGDINSVELSIDGDNFIKAKNILCQFFQTWSRDEIFTLDKNHHIKIIPKDFYSLDDYRCFGSKQQVLTVKKEIPIMKNKNSSEIAATLKVGEKVKLLGTDYDQWVLLENSEGIKGWIEVDVADVKVLNTFSGNVFDGLFFAG